MDQQTRKLGEVCALIKGKRPESFVINGGRPYLTAKVVRGAEMPKFASNNSSSSVSVKSDDIVIIMDGSNSGETFTGLEGVLASTMGIVSCLYDQIDSRYLLKFLSFHRENFTKSRTGSAIPHLNKEEFENLEIPLPSFFEQQRIAKVLDETFAAIVKVEENTEKNLRNSREVFENYLQSFFNRQGSFKKTTLGQETDLLIGFAFKSDKYTEDRDGIRLLRGDNIMQGFLRWEDAKKWSNNNLKDYGQYQLRESDVVLAMDRPWTKAGLKHAIISSKDLPCLLVQRTACIRVGREMNSKFLMYLMSGSNFVKHILKSQTGSGVPHISGKQIQSFQFVKSSLSEQNSSVAKLDVLSEQTKRLEEIYKRKIELLEELKKSVLKKAFLGEL